MAGDAFSIRQAGSDDLAELTELAYRTFWETYEPFNTRENMDMHSGRFLTMGAIRSDMEEDGAAFLIAEIPGDMAGFAHLRVAHTPEYFSGQKVMEIARLYVAKGHQSAGLGRGLIHAAEERAITQGCAAVWLGVWEHNDKARRFYQRCGFAQFGEHEYVLGKERQRDFLHMKLTGGPVGP